METLRESIKKHVESLPKKEDANTKKVQRFNMLLYTETDSYRIKSVLDWVQTCDKVVSYAFIKHDADIFTEDTFDSNGLLIGRMGEKKKDHYHVVVNLAYRTPICDLSTWMGVPQRFIENCKSLDGSLLYLTHRNAPEKHQYPCDNVVTNIKPYHDMLWNNYEEKRSLDDLFYEYLFQASATKKPLSLSAFHEYLRDMDISSSQVRKTWNIYRDLINERRSGRLQQDRALYMNRMEHEERMQFVKNVLKNTSAEKIDWEEDDGRVITYTLTEDGKVDVCGYSFENADAPRKE